MNRTNKKQREPMQRLDCGRIFAELDRVASTPTRSGTTYHNALNDNKFITILRESSSSVRNDTYGWTQAHAQDQ